MTTQVGEKHLALVVDDDDLMRLMVSEAVQNAGLEIVEASNGQEAVEKFEEFAPDIIILDVIMPVMDGFEACTQIRTLPNARHTPILMMTGLDDLESINRAYDAGATDFTTKPVNYALLEHRIRYMLRGHRAMLEVEQTMERLRSSEQRRAKAQQIARLGNWEWNSKTKRIHASEELYDILGLTRENFSGRHDELLIKVHDDDRINVSEALERCLSDGVPFSIEHRVVTPTGCERVIRQEAEPVVDDVQEFCQVVGTAQDITERRNAEHKIVHLAYYDSLTGLPNRTFLREHLNHLLENARRYERPLAVLSLDLDLFKRINDSLGHTAGDRLLQQVAGRIGESMRGGDFLVRTEPALASAVVPGKSAGDTVARLGGDEFIIVLSEIKQAKDASAAAMRITESMNSPFSVDGSEVYITASVGISVCPADGDDVESLLKNADTAMHHAKEHGRNRFLFYEECMNKEASERLSLGNSLHRALERGEFELHYQPRVDTQKKKVVGVEALARWRHPTRGMVSPTAFVPLAEENGLIVALGEWVIRNACMQNRAWQKAGLEPIQIAVNLSSQQFNDRQLLQTIDDALAQSGLAAEYLEVELTESMLMDDSQVNNETLAALKELGIQIALDDFGTGYSSLSYLNRLPIDTLKIDRSFVCDLEVGSSSATIAAAIIALSKSLGLGVIAEGVETVQQLNFMTAHRCFEIQGNYFSTPLPADALKQWIEAGNYIGALSPKLEIA